jgi:hypothetical protein
VKRSFLLFLSFLFAVNLGEAIAMGSEEYEQKKAAVNDKYIPWAVDGIGGSANKTIDVMIDWSGFDKLPPEEGAAAVDRLMDQIRTAGPIIRGMLVAESYDQRQLVRTRVDGLRFEYTDDAQQPLVSSDGNALVFKVIAGAGAASREDLWAAADVLQSMPASSGAVAEESPFDFWQINTSALVLPELQNKLTDLSAKEIVVDADWQGFDSYESAEDWERVMKQFQELVRRVQFAIRGMLFTGGVDERQLVRTRVDRILFGHAADAGQKVMSADGNTLIFLLSPDGEPVEKDQLFFNLPELVKTMPVSPNPVPEETR